MVITGFLCDCYASKASGKVQQTSRRRPERYLCINSNSFLVIVGVLVYYIFPAVVLPLPSFFYASSRHLSQFLLCNFLLMKLLLRWPRHTKQTPRLPVVIVFILHSPETFGAFSRDSSPVRRGRYRPAFLCGCVRVCSVDFSCNPAFRVSRIIT